MMSNLYKKLLLTFLTFVILLSSNMRLFARNVSAAPPAPKPTPTVAPTSSSSSWYNQNPFTWYAKVNDNKNPSEIFGERYTFAQVQWILYSLITFPISVVESFNSNGSGSCLLGLLGGSSDPVSCITGYFDSLKNVLSTIGIAKLDENKTFIASVFDSKNRDISFINYVSNTSAKFSIVKTVNAQDGFGFGALGIAQKFWEVSRNASYAIIVLVVIIFSFMIMFRVKLSPQTVISVQSALPKIVTVLILATFSFAIAGFVVDLMYVFMGFVSALLASVDGSQGMSFGFVYSFVSGNWLGVHVSSFLVVFIYMILYTILFLIAIIANFFAALSSWSVFGMILAILFLLVTVWLVILCFVYMVRIPWILIKALAQIYMSIIVAPLQIVFGAIAPQGGFNTWIKNLIANLLVFPVTGIFFFLAYWFIFKSIATSLEVGFERNVIAEFIRMFGFDIQGLAGGSLWSPPLLGSGAEVTGLIFTIMSFMIIVAIPKVTEIMKMLIMGEKFAFGTAIGEAMAPAKWAWGQAYGQSGAKDVFELSQLARKSRILDKTIGDTGWLRPYVERFVGGGHDDASTAINNAVNKYKTSAGRASEV